MSQRGAKVCLYFSYGGLDLRVSESTRSEGVLIVGHAGIERPFFHGVNTEVTNLNTRMRIFLASNFNFVLFHC